MIHSRFLYWIDNKELDLFPFYMFTNFTKSLNNSLQDVDILFVIRGNLVRFFLINTDPYFANTLKLSIFRQTASCYGSIWIQFTSHFNDLSLKEAIDYLHQARLQCNNIIFTHMHSYYILISR